MSYFEHERLVAHQRALEVLRGVSALRGSFAGSGWLFQQSIRAAGSVVLNVAEGASLHSKGAKKRHYQIAQGSCGELGAALDVADAVGVCGTAELIELNRDVNRILGGLAR